MTNPKKILKNKMEVIICDHCHKKITSPELAGLTLVCPHCKKSVNGQYYHAFIIHKNSEDMSLLRKKKAV